MSARGFKLQFPKMAHGRIPRNNFSRLLELAGSSAPEGQQDNSPGETSEVSAALGTDAQIFFSLSSRGGRRGKGRGGGLPARSFRGGSILPTTMNFVPQPRPNPQNIGLTRLGNNDSICGREPTRRRTMKSEGNQMIVKTVGTPRCGVRPAQRAVPTSQLTHYALLFLAVFTILVITPAP